MYAECEEGIQSCGKNRRRVDVGGCAIRHLVGRLKVWVSRFRPQASEARASAPDKAEAPRVSAATSAEPGPPGIVYVCVSDPSLYHPSCFESEQQCEYSYCVCHVRHRFVSSRPNLSDRLVRCQLRREGDEGTGGQGGQDDHDGQFDLRTDRPPPSPDTTTPFRHANRANAP
jgi:hypothetical protein